MRRIVLLVLFAGCFMPSVAWAGGSGHDSCPPGYKSYIVQDAREVSTAQYNQGQGFQVVHLPEGDYVFVATGSSGTNDTPSDQPYGALCTRDATAELVPSHTIVSTFAGNTNAPVQSPTVPATHHKKHGSDVRWIVILIFGVGFAMLLLLVDGFVQRRRQRNRPKKTEPVSNGKEAERIVVAQKALQDEMAVSEVLSRDGSPIDLLNGLRAMDRPTLLRALGMRQESVEGLAWLEHSDPGPLIGKSHIVVNDLGEEQC